MCTFSHQKFLVGNKPKKLIVFLHGYNSCIEDLLPYANILEKELNDVIIAIPMADLVCERNNLKKQWFGLNDIDPTRKRRNTETSIDEIIEIYNNTGDLISNVSKKINSFVSALQKEYKIKNKDTYIIGFSQGAMIAIYAGLSRRYKVGGIFSLAGIISGKDMLDKELSSRPNVYLFHGTSDVCVQYKTLNFTKKWLDNHKVYWEAFEYDGIDHRITNEEINEVVKIIKKEI
ncbi:MAG: hypothetical protein IKW39_02875 [Alphaproteobacteria bacterium]|nr:hypothetical protein [Alphaproteobacteria bacterium]